MGQTPRTPAPVGKEGPAGHCTLPLLHSTDAAPTGHPARARQALPAKELAHLLRSTSAITFPLDPQSIPKQASLQNSPSTS